MAPKSFTGRSRRRTTRPSVRAWDLLARSLITIGGVGTIVAVSAVCVFLAWVVLPLFLPAKITPLREIASLAPQAKLLHVAVDEHQVLGWSLDQSGTLRAFRLDKPEAVEERLLFGDRQLTAASFSLGGDACSFGFADGTVQLGRVRFLTRFLKSDELPIAMRALGEKDRGELAVYDGGVLQRTSEGQFRKQSLAVDLEEAFDVDPAAASAVVRVDHIDRASGPLVSALTADDKLRLVSQAKRKNLLTGEDVVAVKRQELPYDAKTRGLPLQVKLAGLGDNVYVLWKQGTLARFNVYDPTQPVLAEEVDLLGGEAGEITAAEFLLGRGTLVTGDSQGRVKAWFRVRPPVTETAAAKASEVAVDKLVAVHQFSAGGAAVTSLAPSQRMRMLAAGLADGRVRLWHVTSEKDLGDIAASSGKPVTLLALSPKDDGLMVISGGGEQFYRVEAGHPEVTLSALFLPVWYEGYDKPMHVWQSSAATQDFEPKLGLWPLIFGTLKATCYSMLFGAPIALLAAIYTSEFLSPRVKAKIKPVIELMASLPSVVLGFVAALVIAPLVENAVPTVLASFLIVPATFLLGAYLWQLLPYHLGLVLTRYRFFFILPTLPLGVLLARQLGPSIERWLFGGNLTGWLDGSQGSGTGGWILLLLPLCGAGVFFLGREVNTRLRPYAKDWTRTQIGLVSLAKFLLGALLAVGLAWTCGAILNAAGFDPRGEVYGPYDQRNALIVGFVMGFAIIPLIYTIAEDALSTVPEHLRSASLGAGATPWQTAVRIVIPTAMSGLFSALMIGLGRAVGETMIVLMAAGNTPVMDLNVFNGFRTLSANVAVELPEAPVDSTHYRTLFLAALTLFLMTFAVNTVAEIVRQRFRRRAYEL